MQSQNELPKCIVRNTFYSYTSSSPHKPNFLMGVILSFNFMLLQCQRNQNALKQASQYKKPLYWFVVYYLCLQDLECFNPFCVFQSMSLIILLWKVHSNGLIFQCLLTVKLASASSPSSRQIAFGYQKKALPYCTFLELSKAL